MKSEKGEIENGVMVDGGGAVAGAAADAAAVGSGADAPKYRADQVVLVECEHVREMRGETDEVIRRTRSVAAENAVLNAVREGGVEPDWFCEWWVEVEGRLVACAVFEDAEKTGGFRKEIQAYAQKLADRGDECPVRLRADEVLAKTVAAHFSAEWEARRAEQMGRYREVLADARKGGAYDGRVLVGEYVAKDADAKAAFAKVAEELNALFPKDGAGEGGLVYSGYWDRGDVARFCFGFSDSVGMKEAHDRLNALGASTWDAVVGDVDGVELEMAALVIAKMQGEERAKAERKKLEDELGAKMAKAVEEGFARSGKRRDAAELID